MRIILLSLCLGFATVTAVGALSACGGAGTATPADVAAPDAGPTPDAGSGTPTVDGGATGSDASSALDGATDADGAAVDTRIDPIDLGRSWTYDVSIIGVYPLCKAGSHVGQVLGEKVVAGKNAFQVQSFCPGAGTSSYAVTGDKVEVYYANTWVLSLDAPVAEGHTWTDGTYSYSWESVGKVTVTAGTFDDCWNARPTVGTSYTTFCRGIGPVRWHFVDGSGNGYDATLTAHQP